jgi:osmotically-inducible protein OsmY
MSERPGEPDPYLAEHLKEVLTRDPRVSGLGIDVLVTAEAVVLTGELSSPEQRDAVETVIRDLMPAHHIRNETTVVDLPEPIEAEALP